MSGKDYEKSGYYSRYQHTLRRRDGPAGGWQRKYWLRGYCRAAKELLHPTLYPDRAFPQIQKG